MTPVLGAVMVASGIGLVWFGALAKPGASGRQRVSLGVRARSAARVGLPMVVLAVVAAVVAWRLLELPALTLLAAAGGAYLPIGLKRAKGERLGRERERAWPSGLDQLADGLEAGLAFPAATAFLAVSGPSALRELFAAFYARVRSGEMLVGLDELAGSGERAAVSVASLLRVAFGDAPTGRAAPVLRELALVLRERWEIRERARSRALSVSREATLLALSPLAFLLLIGASSPGYLAAYRTTGGTVVSLIGALVIFGCYLAMRRLGRVPDPGAVAR
jgi:tight adherence protein B